MKYNAFIFDLNGTMIDDMDYHIRAWHRILNELGADISLERMKEECYGKNEELLERIFPGRYSYEERKQMGFAKEEQYQKEFRPHLKLLDGLEELLPKARNKGLKMAIGSAAIGFNINFVVDGLHIRQYFDTFVSADDVATSKPDPETFLKCATNMSIPAESCLVFEDSPKGVESAWKGGMDCVVLLTQHSAEEFRQFPNVISIINDYTSFNL